MGATAPSANDPRVVLSCVDTTAVGSSVCDHAAWLARVLDAPMTLLHTLEHPPEAASADLSGAIGLGSREELLDTLARAEQIRSRSRMEAGRALLDRMRERAKASGVPAPTILLQHGSLVETVVGMEPQVRVAVVGVRGEAHQASDSGVGAQLETLVRAVHLPLLVVNRPFEEPQRVMLAYNGSTPSRKALSMVALSQAFKKLTCHVVYAGRDGQQHLDHAAQTLRAGGVETHTAQVDGRIEDALVTYQAAHDIDLTIMGAFSHSRIRGFLVGSFTAKMLARTQRPLLLLR